MLKFWLAMAAIIGGFFVVIGGSFLMLLPFMSAKAVGLLWCGLMLIAVIAVFSYSVYDDEKWKAHR